MRARWAALVVALVAAGLIASIPAFIDSSPRSSPKPAATPRPPGWIDTLPRYRAAVTDPYAARVLATASNGEKLLAGRDAGQRDSVCFFLGFSGGSGCDSLSSAIWLEPLSRKHIALLARTRDERGIGWWGFLGGDVKAVQARYKGGSQRRFSARRAFVVFGSRVDPPRSVVALDAGGAVLGTVTRADRSTIECTKGECSMIVFFQSTAP